jgi:hypothetical protein
MIVLKKNGKKHTIKRYILPTENEKTKNILHGCIIRRGSVFC